MMRQLDENPILSSDQDEATSRTAEAHHAGLSVRLKDYTDELVERVSIGADPEPARLQLVKFLHDDLVAHLESERRVLYDAARQVGADTVVASLEVEHELLLSLIAGLDRADSGLEAALAAHAVTVLVTLRIHKEDTVLIPMLAAAGIDAPALLEDMIVQMATEYGSRFTYI